MKVVSYRQHDWRSRRSRHSISSRQTCLTRRSLQGGEKGDVSRQCYKSTDWSTRPELWNIIHAEISDKFWWNADPFAWVTDRARRSRRARWASGTLKMCRSIYRHFLHIQFWLENNFRWWCGCLLLTAGPSGPGGPSISIPWKDLAYN